MKLYKVTPNMPVKFGTYYVAASSFDEAVDLTQAAETSDGGHNGGIDQIEVIGHIEGCDDRNLLLSAEALRILSR